MNHFLLFYVDGCFVCMFVCMPHVSLMPTESRGCWTHPGTGVTRWWFGTIGCWEYNLDTLEEYPALITTKPFLQLRVPSRLFHFPLGTEGLQDWCCQSRGCGILGTETRAWHNVPHLFNLPSLLPSLSTFFFTVAKHWYNLLSQLLVQCPTQCIPHPVQPACPSLQFFSSCKTETLYPLSSSPPGVAFLICLQDLVTVCILLLDWLFHLLPYLTLKCLSIWVRICPFEGRIIFHCLYVPVVGLSVHLLIWIASPLSLL